MLTQKILLCLSVALLTVGGSLRAQKPPALDLFRTYITGDFDNARQIAQQQKKGTPTHPFARHINRVADDKIRNLPSDLNGFFLLEESYYEYTGKPTDIKPYLFLFQDAGPGRVRLSVFQLPPDIPVTEITNDNPNLSFDYHQLRPSPTFKPAEYELRGRAFYLNAPNELGNGMRFTLIEKITKNRLEVMELLEKDGQRLTPYDTPIIYGRRRRK